MAKDNVNKIMEQLAQEKNIEVTKELVELKKKRDEMQRKYNGLTSGELYGLEILIR